MRSFQEGINLNVGWAKKRAEKTNHEKKTHIPKGKKIPKVNKYPRKKTKNS